MSLRSYIWPASVSLLFHAAIVLLAVVGWTTAVPEREVKTPRYVQAQLVELERKAKKAVSPDPQQVKKVDLTERRRQEALAEKRAQEKRAAEQRRKEAQAQKRREEEAAERRQQAERERQQEQERQRRRQEEFEKALREEQGLIMEDQYATQAQSYMDMIAQRIERNWSRPPSARKGMQVVLDIQMIPNGQVVNVSVAESSGNAAFDRSAIQAVRKVERFSEVQDMPIEVFERYYRSFKLKFIPQDLRQ